MNYSPTLFGDDIDLGTVAGKCKVPARCDSTKDLKLNFFVHVPSQQW